MSITTPIKVKTFTRSFVLWLSNGFGFCGNVGKIALPTAKRNICKPSKREAVFSPPCICRINPKIYGRQGSEDYCLSPFGLNLASSCFLLKRPATVHDAFSSPSLRHLHRRTETPNLFL